MNNYWIRLRDVITFLFIWLSLPLYFSYRGDEFIGAVIATILIMWIPAIYITLYLSGEE